MKIKKPIAVYVDRLEAALAAQGIDLQRTKILELAASALGYHNTHECTTASQRGDLAPPMAEPLCRLEIPGGEALIVLRDPKSGAPYAIDETFIEQVVEGERRETYGPSPYGGLLDLSEVAAHPATAWNAATSEAPEADPVRLVGLDRTTVAYAVASTYKGQPIVEDGRLMVRCPTHDDTHPSLVVAGDVDGLTMKCLAGCPDEEVQRAVVGIMCRRQDVPEDAAWVDVFEVHATYDGLTYHEWVGVTEDEDIELKARRLVAEEFRMDFDEEAKWDDDTYEFDGDLDTIRIEYAELAPQVAALALTIRKAMRRMGEGDPLRLQLERDLRDIMPMPTVFDEKDEEN